MLKFFVLGFFFAASLALASPSKPVLVVYAYDSFAASGGLGPEIRPLFEKKCGCDLRILPSGDAAQLVNRMELDAKRGKSVAQVVVGLDQQTWDRAKPTVESWGTWLPEAYSKIPKQLRLGEGFVPFDYGAYAFIADTEALVKLKLPLPRKLSDLLTSAWKRQILLEDPRTSAPGLAFLLFTAQLHAGESFTAFWRGFRSQWLTLAPGWDGAYGLFLKGEAPLVWSYVTSQAYHEEHGDRSHRYRAIMLEEGAPFQIEGAAIVRAGVLDESARRMAQDFLSFLVSEEVQKLIPLKNWMLPVREDVALPKSFSSLPRLNLVSTGSRKSAALLSDWSRTVNGASR